MTAFDFPTRPTDAALGMTWWNRLTERERREWMRRAGDTGVAADAWAAFKAGVMHPGGMP